jgi:hypothetical protein
MRQVLIVLAVLVFGTALGTLLTIPVLALAGAFVRIPGVQPILNQIFTAQFDAPLMWGLLVAAWTLGIVITYVIVTLAMKSRDDERGVD